MKKRPINWLLTGVIVVIGITIWCMSPNCKSGKTTEQTQSAVSQIDTLFTPIVVLPGNVESEIPDTVPKETIHEEPFAWKPDTIPYLFGKPSARKIKEYKRLFDQIHQDIGQWRKEWEEYLRLPIDQWYIINDLDRLSYEKELHKYLNNTELILWRLNQFAPMQLSPGETAMDRYNKLQTQIDSALNYDPNNLIGNTSDFQTYYYVQNILDNVSETILTQDLYAICTSDTLKNLLRQKQSAFKAYRKSEKNLADDILLGGSWWWFTLIEFMRECDQLNRDSKMVLFARLTQSTDTMVSYPYKVITKSAISAEYKKTEHYLCYHELTYELTDTIRIHSLLNKDKAAWFRWMQARATVSASLTGNIKSDYDNTTNRMKRAKLIQLKNRFNGYGVMSNQMSECLLSDDCTDKELQEQDFEKRWDEY